MKKIFAILLAAIMLLSGAALCVSAENTIGDTDGNGYINLSDVAAIMMYCAKWDLSEHCPDFSADVADVTVDGTVNLQDVSRLLQHIAKWDVPPPYIPEV